MKSFVFATTLLSSVIALAGTELPNHPLPLAQAVCQLRAHNAQLDTLMTHVKNISAVKNPAKYEELKAKIAEAKKELNKVIGQADAKYQSLTTKKVDHIACNQIQAGVFPGQMEASKFVKLQPNAIQNAVCQIKLQLYYQNMLTRGLVSKMDKKGVSEAQVLQMVSIGLSTFQDNMQSEINLAKRVYLAKTGKALQTNSCPRT